MNPAKELVNNRDMMHLIFNYVHAECEFTLPKRIYDDDSMTLCNDHMMILMCSQHQQVVVECDCGDAVWERYHSHNLRTLQDGRLVSVMTILSADSNLNDF